MQISIKNPYKFKSILGEVIKFTSKDKYQTALQSVRFYRHKIGSYLVMEAVDGYRMIQETVDADFAFAGDEEAFSLLASDLKLVSKSLISEIGVNPETVTFTTFDNVQMTLKISESHSLTFERIAPKDPPGFSILMDPKKLMSVCQAFKDVEGIRLDFHGELGPCVVYRGSKPEKATGCAMVLPLHP